jgi:hypothetical protein
MGIELNAQSASSWLAACCVFLVGAAIFEVTRRRFAVQWSVTQEYIETEIKRKESL